MIRVWNFTIKATWAILLLLLLTSCGATTSIDTTAEQPDADTALASDDAPLIKPLPSSFNLTTVPEMYFNAEVGDDGGEWTVDMIDNAVLWTTFEFPWVPNSCVALGASYVHHDWRILQPDGSITDNFIDPVTYPELFAWFAGGYSEEPGESHFLTLNWGAAPNLGDDIYALISGYHPPICSDAADEPDGKSKLLGYGEWEFFELHAILD